MRIAFLTTEYPTEAQGFDGGLANYLQRVALALVQLGHHPLIIIPANEDGIIFDRGIEIHRVAMKKWGSYDMVNRGTLFRFHMSSMILRASRKLVRRALQLP